MRSTCFVLAALGCGWWLGEIGRAQELPPLPAPARAVVPPPPAVPAPAPAAVADPGPPVTAVAADEAVEFMIHSNFPINAVYQFSRGPEEAILRVKLKPHSGVSTELVKAELRRELPQKLPGVRLDRKSVV